MLLAALTIAARSSEQTPSFVLGIVRLDGGIVPFAAYDGRGWERAWPEAAEKIETVRSADDVASIWRKRGERVPRVWNVWPASGAPAVQAQVTGIEDADAHCEKQLALKTDLPAIKGDPHKKFGVATDSTIPLGSIEAVPESSDFWRIAARAVVANFGKLEAAQAQKEPQVLPTEMPAPVIRLLSVYRETNSPSSPVYFVAEKRYRSIFYEGDPTCARVTLITGWLTPTIGGALRVLDAKVYLTSCDRKEARIALPLAAVHVGNQLFWVLQEHGWEDETYVIAEIGPDRVRYPIEVAGGGC